MNINTILCFPLILSLSGFSHNLHFAPVSPYVSHATFESSGKEMLKQHLAQKEQTSKSKKPNKTTSYSKYQDSYAITFKVPPLHTNQLVDAAILDLYGKTVKTFHQIQLNSQNSIYLSWRDPQLKPGYYLVKIKAKDMVFNKHFRIY